MKIYHLACKWCGVKKDWARDLKGPGPCPCGKKIWTVIRPYP